MAPGTGSADWGGGPQLEGEGAACSVCAMLWKSNPEEMGTLGGAEKVTPASEAGLGGEEGS